MKHGQSIIRFVAVGCMLALLAGICLAQDGPVPHVVPADGAAPKGPVGTGFTYQGRLTDGGSPANGPYDFEFRLYDVPSGGTQVGTMFSVADQLVVDGLFTVQLDFGDVFGTAALYLGVSVRPGASTGAYTPLSPRQAITPSPLAQVASRVTAPLALSGSFSAPVSTLSVSNTSGHGIYLPNTYGIGVMVNTAGSDGFYVQSAGLEGLHVNNSGSDGVWISTAGANGLGIYQAAQDGVHVTRAGTPSTTVASTNKNGFEVEGAQGAGLYVGRADGIGVHINTVGSDGVYVHSAHGEGLHINESLSDAIWVGMASYNGVGVFQSGQDGMHVVKAGVPSATNASTLKNGFEVEGAQGHGLYVGRADYYGVAIESAANSGLYVNASGGDGAYMNTVADDALHVQTAGWYGVLLNSVGQDGLRVNAAGDDGVDVTGTDYAGYFAGNVQVTGTCTGCKLSVFGVNAGDRPIQPGEPVAIRGMAAATLDNAAVVWQVVPAGNGGPAVGVAAGAAELETAAQGQAVRDGETGRRLVPRQGAAAPGAYVVIVTHGPMQVGVSVAGGPIAPGTRLAVDDGGRLRALKTVMVDGVALAESAPVLGIALEAADRDGLVWVLVNPQ